MAKKTAQKSPAAPAAASLTAFEASRARINKPFTAAEKAAIKADFLAKFLNIGTVYMTLESLTIPITYPTWAQWISEDPAFESAYKHADERVTQLLETSALNRAVNGVVRPVISHGKPVVDAAGNPVVTRDYSDDLTKFLLKSRNREKYGDQIRHEFNVRIAQQLSGEFVKVVRRIEPQLCQTCRTHVKLSERVAQDLMSASAKLKNV